MRMVTGIVYRFGTRLHFKLMFITKVDTINDNVVTTTYLFYIYQKIISIIEHNDI